MRIQLIRTCMTLAAVFFCSTASAHPGHPDSMFAGVLHPLLGLDHLIALIGIGMWSAQLGGNARWLMPASFTLIMAASAGMAIGLSAVPAVELGVAASVLLIGLMIALSVKVHPVAGALIAGVFALSHGFAHGVEMPALATPWLYGAGFVAASIALQFAGLTIGSKLRQKKWGLPALGSFILACGGVLLSAA